MPLKKKIKRRPPSDARALRGATDPGVLRTTLIALGLIIAFGIGAFLVVRGVF